MDSSIAKKEDPMPFVLDITWGKDILQDDEIDLPNNLQKELTDVLTGAIPEYEPDPLTDEPKESETFQKELVATFLNDGKEVPEDNPDDHFADVTVRLGEAEPVEEEEVEDDEMMEVGPSRRRGDLTFPRVNLSPSLGNDGDDDDDDDDDDEFESEGESTISIPSPTSQE